MEAGLLWDGGVHSPKVMHPASPLTHHDRLSAVLKGMDHDDDDSAAPAEDAPKDDAKDVPADPFAIPDDAKVQQLLDQDIAYLFR